MTAAPAKARVPVFYIVALGERRRSTHKKRPPLGQDDQRSRTIGQHLQEGDCVLRVDGLPVVTERGVRGRFLERREGSRTQD